MVYIVSDHFELQPKTQTLMLQKKATVFFCCRVITVILNRFVYNSWQYECYKMVFKFVLSKKTDRNYLFAIDVVVGNLLIFQYYQRIFGLLFDILVKI